MPNYRVIPFHKYSEFIHNKDLLDPDIAGEFVELLPSWMTVLKRIDPSNILTSIKLSSSNTELDNFITLMKQKLSTFNYPLEEGEWLSFITSPIKIISNNSSWVNDLTFWSSYSKFINDELVADSDYNFELPIGFLKQVSRRSRSWDYFHYVNPNKDIAVQFFSGNEITQSILNIEKIHDTNIKGQLVLWECKKAEIREIADLLTNLELSLRIIDDSDELCLIAITTIMFDPFMCLYSVAMDWDSFENGNVRIILEKNNLLKILPGNEYKGKIPDSLEDALNRHSNTKYTKVLTTEIEYIPGFPLMNDEREIRVSRYQMINFEFIPRIKAKLNEIKPIDAKNFKIDFDLIDDYMWKIPIYELAISWTPDLLTSSKDSFQKAELLILEIFNKILPTCNGDSMQLKNTFEILHIAGEIGFEDNEG